MLKVTSSVPVIWRSRPARHSNNVGRALAAARTRPEQVTKITIFVVDHRDEYLPAIEAGRAALFGDHKPADTLVGVSTLSPTPAA